MSSSTQKGYILLPVVITIALLAMFAYLMNSESTMENRNIRSDLEKDRLRYLTQSGVNHALWQLQHSGCTAPANISSQNFAQGSYSIDFLFNNAGGLTQTITVPVSDDAWIKSDTATQNYGSDAQLSTYYDSNTGVTERSLYRFDLAAAGIPANSLLVSAVFKLYVIDSNTSAAVTVHQITADWTEASVNWSNINTAYQHQAAATIPSATPAGQIYDVNLTSLVQGWINGSVINQGVMLISTAGFDLAQYSSKEYATVSLRPVLEVIVSDGSISNRADIIVNASLTNNSSQQAFLKDIILYEAVPHTLQQQPDSVSGKDSWVTQDQATNNYGITPEMVIDGSSTQKYFLGYFDIDSIPFDARVHLAQLEMSLLYTSSFDPAGAFTVYEMLQDWQEGTGNYWNPGDGADWNTYDAVNSWSWQTNNDINFPVATTLINPAFVGPQQWDIRPMVQKWVSGKTKNYGFTIKGNSVTVGAGFASSDYTTVANRPTLTINYACECGVVCQSPQGTGKVLFIVGDSVAMTVNDIVKLELLHTWGYTVTVIDDDDTQLNFDTAISKVDAAYISKSINSLTLQTKLSNPAIGILNENTDFMTILGIADTSSFGVGKAFDIIDNSHYITSVFPTGVIPFYRENMERHYLTGGLAVEQQTLVEFNGHPLLEAVESKALLSDGTTKASGRRVALAAANNTYFDWRFANNNTRLLVQRALQWVIDGIPYIYVPKKIYWTDDNAELIQRCDEDGSNIENIIREQLKVRGMDIDTINGKIYWSSDSYIKRANLDGSNIEIIYINTREVTLDVKVDAINGKVYWTFDNSAGVVMRADLDGTNSEIINNTINETAYFTIDPVNSHIYITQFGDGNITRINTDGSNQVNIVSGINSAVGNALDIVNGKVYWTGGATNDWIKRANMDGSNEETIISGLTSPQDIDYDPDNEKIYWTDASGQSIHRANPDGTNIETIVSNRVRPRGIKIISATLVPKTGPATLNTSCSGTYTDNFNTRSYSNNDGSLIWSSDWIEINESDGPTLGDEKVIDDNGPYQLQIKDNDGGGEGVVRELNLSGATTAVVNFDYRRKGLDNIFDYVSVSISANGSAGPWTELVRLKGMADDASYLSYSSDISAYISNKTQIRFLSSANMANIDIVYFDNIEITCTP